MTQPNFTEKRTQALIIGAGPAGLAVGACLKRAGIESVLLEQADQVGAAWRAHYDRLHLHTDKRNSQLPFDSFPRDFPRYPARAQVIEYLEAYARKFELKIEFGQRVTSARQVTGGWEVRTGKAVYRAPNLVIATGCAREPVRPEWAGEESFKGRILHSSEYRNGQPFRGQRVLVIGFGNSGGEIAMDLWEHGAFPGIAVRSAVNVIPRELFGIPILSIGIVQRWWPPGLADAVNAPILRMVIGDLTRYGLRRLPRGPIAQIRRDGRIPLIDVGTVALIKQGRIAVHPGIEGFTPTGVKFSDGSRADFDAVILATGFQPRVDAFLQALPAAYDEAGRPRVSGGRAVQPGLYFCGYFVSPTGMLREIAIEARQISAAIAGAGAPGAG
jgi:cation diffusion facilitator CzcD-associated flavoprotein CzcO